MRATELERERALDLVNLTWIERKKNGTPTQNWVNHFFLLLAEIRDTNRKERIREKPPAVRERTYNGRNIHTVWSRAHKLYRHTGHTHTHGRFTINKP